MARYSLLKLRHSQSEAEAITEINIIPVIDISLVLLVILFVTAPLLSYPNHPVSLPKTRTLGSSENFLAVTCTKDGRLAVRSADSDWSKLEGDIRGELKRSANMVVLLRIDKGVPYRVVQNMLAAAKAAGAKDIALATEPAK